VLLYDRFCQEKSAAGKRYWNLTILPETFPNESKRFLGKKSTFRKAKVF
jgi:hypothetical protein